MRCSCWNSAVNLVDSGRCVVPVGTLWFDLNAAKIHCNLVMRLIVLDATENTLFLWELCC